MTNINNLAKMKAWSLQQLDDAEQVVVLEEDPSPVDTAESNEEFFAQADHLYTGHCKFCSWEGGCDISHLTGSNDCHRG